MCKVFSKIAKFKFHLFVFAPRARLNANREIGIIDVLAVESDGRSRLSPAARQATRCDSVVTAIDRQEELSPSHKKWREEVLQKVVIG